MEINELDVIELIDENTQLKERNIVLEKALELALRQLYPEPFYRYDESYKKAYIDKARLLEIEKETK